MTKYAQLVMGPAGCGKSSYCSTMIQHLQVSRRSAHVINLDPAAESFDYDVAWDIREMISVDDVAEALSFGPNGGLIYCMEFLLQNIEVLEEAFDFDDDYLIIDCPGQIELYTHLPIMRQFVTFLQSLDFHIVGLYLLDAQFIDDTAKFFSGILSATSAMIQLEIPHLNLLSKMDLVSPDKKDDIENYLNPDAEYLLMSLNPTTSERQHRLNEAMASLINDFSLVRFIAFDRTDEDAVAEVLMQADHCLQYGEDEEPRDPDMPHDEDAGDADDDNVYN